MNEAGLLTFQCQTLRRRPTTANNANPAINTNNISGSGTTRISASFACADSRRHGPLRKFAHARPAQTNSHP